MKTIIGVLLGLGIGVACRWFDVPVPAPPRLMGAILVLSLTTGYVMTDRFLAAPERTASDPTVAEHAGGPAVEAPDRRTDASNDAAGGARPGGDSTGT